MDCRKHHGALFYAAAVFPQSVVQIFGEANGYADRFFCPFCGSPVFARSEDEIEIHLGSFDTPNLLTPTYEGWTIHREKWLPEFPGMTSYSKSRDSSDETEDHKSR